jgi:hypothetical protein
MLGIAELTRRQPDLNGIAGLKLTPQERLCRAMLGRVLGHPEFLEDMLDEIEREAAQRYPVICPLCHAKRFNVFPRRHGSSYNDNELNFVTCCPTCFLSVGEYWD